MASIWLCRSDFGHVSVLRAARDFVTHAHPELHVVIHIDGAPGTMIVDGRPVTPSRDVAIGINSLVPHSHTFGPGTEPGRFLAIYLDPEWVARRHPSGTRPFGQAAIPLDAGLRRAVGEVLDHLDDGKTDGRAIETLVDRLIAAASRSAPRRRRPARRPVDFRVRRAIETMKANLCERICFDDLARSVGLSRPHFFALFKDQTHLTPNVYWNTLRMEEAVRQLEASEEPLTELAFSLGFTSQSNFTRFFRDHTGVPPTLYREASRVEADFPTLR